MQNSFSSLLTEDALSNLLEKILERIEQTSELPDGYSRENVRDTIKDTLQNIFGSNSVPKDVFNEKEHFDQILTLTQTAIFAPTLEKLTENLSKILQKSGPNALSDPKTMEACRELIKLAVKMQTGKEPSAAETNRLATAMIDKLQTEMKSTPRPKPGPRSDKREEGISEEDDFNAQMYGVTKSGILIILQHTIGNSVGASDIAVLQSTAALAGVMFRADNTAARLSPDGIATLDRYLTAISGSYEGAHDALKAVTSAPRPEGPRGT